MALLWLAHLRAPLRGVSSGGVRFEGASRPICSFHRLAHQTGCITAGQIRGYANMTDGWGFKKVQYTKYRITKPWTTDTQFDDLLLSEPSRSVRYAFCVRWLQMRVVLESMASGCCVHSALAALLEFPYSWCCQANHACRTNNITLYSRIFCKDSLCSVETFFIGLP